MTNNAYLIVTDLHLDFSKANRLDYLGELLYALQDILAINDKYLKQGYRTNLILLGDVFDGALTNSSEAMQALELMRFFTSNFSATYAVVGNHEMTYAKDNPFWFLTTSIEDEALLSIRRYVQPRGMNNTIVVPDTLTDGDTVFYFNHFGINSKIPTQGVVKIGLFHQNVGSNDICKMWGTFDNVEEAAYIQAYNYCFFGHMHEAKGKYYLNSQRTCLCEWLGTIGRTKITEIRDDNLRVNIPTVLIEDGTFLRLEDNYLNLKSYAESVDVAKLSAANRAKKLVEDHKELASNSYTGKSLLETLQGTVQGGPLEFLLGFLNSSWDNVLFTYKATLKSATLNTEENSHGE